MLTIRRFDPWSPESTPPPGVRPAYQVSTNGRGAVIYLPPPGMAPQTRHASGTGGGLAVTPRPPKIPMDPSDRSTWQRDYAFNTGSDQQPTNRTY